MNTEDLRYRLGGLLYCPAINPKIANKLANKSIPGLTSMAFCLEDSIQDDALKEAEINLKFTLQRIKETCYSENMPLLFVRIRNPKHLLHIHKFLGDAESVVTGYILPKFDSKNADEYLSATSDINSDLIYNRNIPIYVMPIIESIDAAYVSRRHKSLEEIKHKVDEYRQYILNIRVGGNDFSNLYGLRRPSNRTIYDLGIIRDILIDILNTFSQDYVVSGPVWEYFGTHEKSAWAIGLKNELELDRLNGFIGKTAIHPSQLPLINDSLRVTKADYLDALRITKWEDSKLGVEKSSDGSRMNEVKCHGKWAERVVTLGNIYGIKDD